MDRHTLLEILHLSEKLKDTPRHCFTSAGRRESVAEHCWRAGLMAFFLQDEFPGADMNKVIKLCLVHDLGEIFTGDIPSFCKTAGDEARESAALQTWIDSLPEVYRRELTELFAELEALETREAKIFKAIDTMEAVIQHNESDIATWLPREYELNPVYGQEYAAFDPYLRALRELLHQETLEKIRREGKAEGRHE